MKKLYAILAVSLMFAACEKSAPFDITPTLSQIKYEVTAPDDANVEVNGTEFAISKMPLIVGPDDFTGFFLHLVASSHSGAVSVQISQRAGYASDWILLAKYEDKKGSGFRVAAVSATVK